MGVPVICNSNVGDVEKIVAEGQVGFILNDFNKKQYEIVIEKMLAFLPADTKRISNYAIKYASLNDGVQRYHEVYNSILQTTNDDKIRL